jgi:hypothetical protein
VAVSSPIRAAADVTGTACTAPRYGVGGSSARSWRFLRWAKATICSRASNQPGNAISFAMSGSEIATAWMCRLPGQLRYQAANPTRRSDRTTRLTERPQRLRTLRSTAPPPACVACELLSGPV